MRTWDENREAMNQLWPTHVWTDEEAKLVKEDLSSLDQGTLYDAVRNVKRKHDTPFVHLKWILDEYHSLRIAKQRASQSKQTNEPRKVVRIDESESDRIASDFIAAIEAAEPSDFGGIKDMVLDKVEQAKIGMGHGHRVIMYAKKRLLGEEPMFGRVNRDGDVQAIAVIEEGRK